jgi:hypothetical protein
MLLVSMQIIATTYYSTIFKTYAFSLYSHLCVYVSILQPVNRRWLRTIWSAPEDDDWVNSEIHSKVVIERVWRCNWRPTVSELRDALGVCDRASLEMHFEAVIERVARCSWRLGLSELRDALGGWDRVNSEIHLEARIERTQSYTPRPWMSELGDALGGRDRVNSEMYLEAMTERVLRCTGGL